VAYWILAGKGSLWCDYEVVGTCAIKIECAARWKGLYNTSWNIVPGDIITLKSGDNIPADCMLITSKDLFVNEATLTGESYPIEKSVSTLPEATPIRDRSNCLFTGTFVVSGIATALVLKTGSATELGKISDRLRTHPKNI